MDESTDVVQEAFGRLQETGGGGHRWADATDIARRGARRRNRRIAGASGGGALLVALVLVITLVPFGPGVTRPSASGVRAIAGPGGSTQLVANVMTARPARTSTANEAAVAADEQAFSLRLTRLLAASAGDDNTLVSPISADIALSMLELGSAGPTVGELASTLDSSGLSAGAQAAGWNDLVTSLLSGQSPGELHLADSLWVADGLHVQAGFLRALGERFGNDTYEADFATDAVRAINAWVSEETAGRITTLYQPGQLAAITELVLVNALHFHAAWSKGLFQSAKIEDEPFFTASGETVSVPTVVDEDQLQSASAKGYEAVQIPYSNGRFAALLVEPTASMDTFLSQLSTASLSSITKALTSNYIKLSMPTLQLSSLGSLDDPLSSMGMAPLFSSADLVPMFGRVLGEQQAVEGVQQAVTLDVNRWGTDAAAATGVGVIGTSAREPSGTFSFDHPYLFLLRDVHTGAILFSTVVNNPAASA